jgi:two-component system chemotaxis sensor kinase CheA
MGAKEKESGEYRKLFLEESQDVIDEWEKSILHLEKMPGDQEHLDSLFRAIHTLKGSAGFVNFQKLQDVAHSLESLLQSVRDAGAGLNPAVTQVLLEGHDLCRKMIEAFADSREYEEDIAGFVQKIEELSGNDPNAQQGAENEKTVDAEAAGGTSSGSGDRGSGDQGSGDRYQIHLEIQAEKKEASLRVLLVRSRLEEIAHIIDVQPSFEELESGKVEDYKCSLILVSENDERGLRNALNIDQVQVHEIIRMEPSPGEADADGEPEEDSGASSEEVVRKAEEVVRVPVEKLDTILNLVGELVIQNSGFISTKGELKERYGMSGPIIDLEEKTESLAKIARDLQDAVMKVRMLPVATVFNRFRRVVRDLARDRGKDIELTIYGEETEIDKKVIDRIGEPLVHMVRNAVDHGIEAQNDRIAFGKDPVGHIVLGAYQEGDHICIEVKDDGLGLDRDRIASKCVENGFFGVEDAREMSDEEVFRYIFLPGFSTAEEVSDISGRGVGLDVVKKSVEEMGGDVRIKSTRGLGTVTTITLPLTMAIIPAILLQSGESLFAIPLSSVREVIKLKRNEFKTMRRSMVIQLRDEVISVVELHDVLELGGNGTAARAREQAEIGAEERDGREIAIVIVDYGGKKIGVGVETLLGNEEIVIKSLSRHYREVEGLVGASILGNGKIVLILDVEAMVNRYYKEELYDQVSVEAVPGSPPVQASAGIRKRERAAAESRGEAPARTKKEAPPREDSQVDEKPTRKGPEGVEAAAEGKQERPAEETGAVAEERGSGEVKPAADTGIAEGQQGATLIELEAEKRELLDEIHTSGAVIATMSMSELMGRDIRVSFPQIRVLPVGSIAADLIGDEEKPVGGIYVGVKGDIDGGVLTVLPMEYLLQFSDLLYGREPGTATSVSKEEVSGLCELGNILSASFIRAMADTTGFTIMQEAPEMSIDMCLPVIDSVIARFNRPGEHILLTEAELFYGENSQAVCYLLLFLDGDSIEKLVRAARGDFADLVEG